MPKIIRESFNNNLVVSAKNEEMYQASNKFWICNKWFEVGYNKVRDHCHIRRKYKVSAHWS